MRMNHLVVYTVTVCSPFTLSYRGADKSLDRHVSGCILFDGENISFDAGLVLYI
jgi:hypothetical protein